MSLCKCYRTVGDVFADYGIYIHSVGLRLVVLNQMKSNLRTYYSAPSPELWGTWYSRLKIKIHNSYYKMRLRYALKGRK